MDSSKAQLRQQLLASDTGLPEQAEVNTMSGFAAHGRSQHPGMPLPMHYQNNNQAQPYNQPQSQYANPGGYSNHDLITPVLEASAQKGAASSRKASMNSMSMQRLFRRKGNQGSHFDDDLGADLGDFSGATMSFNDITHLRGAGRYNTSAAGNMDTMPIIPVLGSVGGSDGAKSLNNVEYRKYMNHQKKMNLAHSARAMSLAGNGSHPVPNQDPRSMSFTNGPNSRNNSLGNPLHGTGVHPNSRAMSLNSNAMFRDQPPAAGYGQTHGPGPNQQRIGLAPQFAHQQNGPFVGRPGPPHQMQGGYGPTSPQFPYQGNNHAMSLRSGGPSFSRPTAQGPRANSLSNNGMPMPHTHNGAYGQSQRSPLMTTGPAFGPPKHRTMADPLQTESLDPRNVHVPETAPMIEHATQSQGPSVTETPPESLMNVLEEDEDEDKLKVTAGLKSSQSSFKFGPSTSSSLPFSEANSDDDHVYNIEDQNSPQISRKSTVTKSNSMRVRKLDLFNTKSRRSIDPDVPFANKTSGKLNEESDFSESEARKSPDQTLSEHVSKGDPSRDSVKAKHEIKLRSLTKNTAFSTLHDYPSAPKESDDEYVPSSDILSTHRSFEEDPDQHSKNLSESRSNFSTYSTDAPNQTQTNPTQESLVFDKPRSSGLGVNAKNDSEMSDDVFESDPDLSREGTQNSAALVDSSSSKRLSFPSTIVKRMSSISRSNSELKLKGLAPSSALLRVDTSEGNAPSQEIDIGKREKRRSVSSLSSKSRSLMKRLSLSGSRKAKDDIEGEEQGIVKRKVSSSASQKGPKSLTFTKEELAIMTCNNELQSELQLVTSELAFSIKRELALEAQLRSKSTLHDTLDSSKLPSNEEREQSKIIADLQEKLNKERKLRFISEEHAILSEYGQSPSALKLDYEKNEIYNQLLAKNEMVIQLQDKLDEFNAERNNNSGNELALRFNELLKENSELKAKLDEVLAVPRPISDSKHRSVDSEADGFYHEDDQALIMSLKTQRDELREMITKLTSSKNVELKIAQEKIKTLEAQLEKVNTINHKLSKRVDKSAHTTSTSRFPSGQGGKLQGFSIVSSSKNFFDE